MSRVDNLLRPPLLQSDNAGRRSIVLLSGGMDSTTAFYKAVEETEVVRALSFNYGQRHSRELLHAANTAEAHGTQHTVIDLSQVGSYLKGSALTDDVEVPHGHYAADNMSVTIVPNRNTIMLSIAVGIAIGDGATEVWAAMHAGDHPIYPDCRPEFITALNGLIPIATESDVQIVAPFIDISKAEIAWVGNNLNVDWMQTYSCYQGGNVHCGRCGTCVERAEAFHLAGVYDPTLYEDPDFWKQAVGVS